MRQFVFGLLCAALVWWGYSAWTSAANGQTHAAPSEDGKPSPVLEMFRGDKTLPAGQAPAAETPPAPPGAAANTAAEPPGADLDALAGQLRAGDAAAPSRAWRLLADPALKGPARASLLQAATGNLGDDAAKTLAALGSNNAFLRSAEGRAVGQRVVELAAAAPPEQSAQLLTQLVEKCMRGNIAKTDSAERAFVDAAAKELRKQVDRTLCDPANLTRARSYTVGKGDTLAGISNRFRKKEGIPVEAMTLAVLNRIHNAKTLREGQKLKVPLDPIKTVVEKRSFLMAVYVGDVILRLYWVGHGADDKTPVTTFKVTEILEKPQWDAPDGNRYPPGSPGNILGKWFVKLTHDYHQGFGIHGTTQPETIGTMASMGCIRMLDPDIEEYANLVPRDTFVEIRDSN